MMAEAGEPMSSAPHWQRDLQNQILIRNAVELRPLQSIISSYSALHATTLRLNSAEVERQQLLMERNELTNRIHELERFAANSSVQTSRERELEAKKDSLHEKLQGYMQLENEYYRGLAELKEVKEKSAQNEERANVLNMELERRQADLQILQKEYNAIRDEYERVRGIVTSADRYRVECSALKDTITQLEMQIEALKMEVADLRQKLQMAPPCKDEDSRAASKEEGALSRGGSFASGAQFADPSLGSSMQATSSSSSMPSHAAMVLADVHGKSFLHGLCVLDDGKHFITSGGDKMMRLWSRNSTQPIKAFHSTSIGLSLDSTSHYMLAGCADHVVRFWDVNNLRVLELSGHTEKVVSVCLSASAQHAFTASSDGTIKLWDIRRRDAPRTLPFQSTCNDVAVAGDVIYSAHYNGSIMLWDRRTASPSSEVRAHQRVATCIRVSASGTLCVSLGKDNAISVRDARMLTKPLQSLQPPELRVGMNWARLAIAPNETCCAVGAGSTPDLLLVPLNPGAAAASANPSAAEEQSGNGMVSTDVLAALKPKVSAAVDSRGQTNNSGGVAQSKGPIFCVVWGLGSKTLVSLSEDQNVVVWE